MNVTWRKAGHGQLAGSRRAQLVVATCDERQPGQRCRTRQEAPGLGSVRIGQTESTEDFLSSVSALEMKQPQRQF